MIDVVYYNNFVRCYRSGKVERIDKRYKTGEWQEVENTAYAEGYTRIRINSKDILRHRLIAFCWLGLECINEVISGQDVCDHEDGNKLNNCVDNLRITDGKGNQENNHVAKGYCWHKATNKWQAKIATNHKTIHLGLFTIEEEAREAYLKAKEKYHTSFKI